MDALFANFSFSNQTWKWRYHYILSFNKYALLVAVLWNSFSVNKTFKFFFYWKHFFFVEKKGRRSPLFPLNGGRRYLWQCIVTPNVFETFTFEFSLFLVTQVLVSGDPTVYKQKLSKLPPPKGYFSFCDFPYPAYTLLSPYPSGL